MSGPLLAVKTVVILEGEREVGNLVERVVRGLGAVRVGRFSSAAEARPQLDRFAPVGLFVVDEQLAGVERGSDFVRWLRAHPTMAATPCLGCSTMPEMIALGQGARAGGLFDYLISKPFDDARLFAALFRCLRAERQV